MPLRDFMTNTATTERNPAMTNGKKSNTPASNLSGVRITEPMLQDLTGNLSVRQLLGLEGTAVQVFECYTESHAHTDSGTPVTQMPDIKAGDRLTTDGVEYVVEWVDINAATFSYGKTLQMYLTKDKRA